MTCVWQSILHGIREDADADAFLGGRRSPRDLVEALKGRNAATPDVKWQGETLSEQAQRENQEWIRDYDVGGIGGGHLVSMADPFMLLLCQVLRVEIVHNGAHGSVRMGVDNPRYAIRLSSDGGHMWA